VWEAIGLHLTAAITSDEMRMCCRQPKTDHLVSIRLAPTVVCTRWADLPNNSLESGRPNQSWNPQLIELANQIVSHHLPTEGSDPLGDLNTLGRTLTRDT
jgi:hypothetical protein